MGRVRRWAFEAVIGVGGKRPLRRDAGIALKINWIGTNARKTNLNDPKGPLVKFDRAHFVLWDEKGPDLKNVAPKLFRYMFEDQHVRVVMSKSLCGEMQEEVRKILKLLENHRPTPVAFPKNISTKHRC